MQIINNTLKSWDCQIVVKRLSRWQLKGDQPCDYPGCQNVVRKLSKRCQNVVKLTTFLPLKRVENLCVHAYFTQADVVLRECALKFIIAHILGKRFDKSTLSCVKTSFCAVSNNASDNNVLHVALWGMCFFSLNQYCRVALGCQVMLHFCISFCLFFQSAWHHRSLFVAVCICKWATIIL